MTTSESARTRTIKARSASMGWSRYEPTSKAANIALYVVPPVVLLLLWELLTRLWPTFYFPAPSDIGVNAATTWFGAPFFEDIVPSVSRLLLGWSLSVIVGLFLGFALGLNRTVRDYVEPITEFLRALPPVALIPIFLLFLGVGDSMKIVFIAGSVVWVIVMNTADGVGSIDATQRDSARIYGIGKGRFLREVVFPAALPKIFAGLTISLSFAIILMAVSEMVAATNGIGFHILESQRRFRILDMWSGIILLSLLGFILNTLLRLVERRVLRWHRGAKGRA